jgi:hypothetical protein
MEVPAPAVAGAEAAAEGLAEASVVVPEEFEVLEHPVNTRAKETDAATKPAAVRLMKKVHA